MSQSLHIHPLCLFRPSYSGSRCYSPFSPTSWVYFTHPILVLVTVLTCTDMAKIDSPYMNWYGQEWQSLHELIWASDSSYMNWYGLELLSLHELLWARVIVLTWTDMAKSDSPYMNWYGQEWQSLHELIWPRVTVLTWTDMAKSDCPYMNLYGKEW